MFYESQVKDFRLIKTAEAANTAVGGSWTLAIFAWASELGPILNVLATATAVIASIMAALYYWQGIKLKKAQIEKLEHIEPDD